MILRTTSKGDKLPSDWGMRLMALAFRFRDLRRPRKRVLDEVEIKSGYQVLDYGCGPGSYIQPLSELVGKTGKVYALDAHPLAIKMVQDIGSKKHLTNVETILAEQTTALPTHSLDVILLYDILHDLGDPDRVLNEIHRMLKIEGTLSLSDHHLKEFEIIYKVTERGRFKLARKGSHVYCFMK